MDSCIFCKIIRKELPHIVVYENEHTLAFLTIEPCTNGHTLVIPKAHSVNIFDISSESWTHTQETVRNVASAILKATNADGLNLAMNNREHAGQLVDHTHVHLIPRFKGDGLKLFPHHPLDMGTAETIAQRIRDSF